MWVEDREGGLNGPMTCVRAAHPIAVGVDFFVVVVVEGLSCSLSPSLIPPPFLFLSLLFSPPILDQTDRQPSTSDGPWKARFELPLMINFLARTSGVATDGHSRLPAPSPLTPPLPPV